MLRGASPLPFWMVFEVVEVFVWVFDELPPVQDDAGAAPHAQVVLVSFMP